MCDRKIASLISPLYRNKCSIQAKYTNSKEEAKVLRRLEKQLHSAGHFGRLRS